MSDNAVPRVQRFGREVVRAAVVELTSRGLVSIGGLLLAGLVALILKGGSVPAWTLVVVAIVVAAVGAVRRRSIARAGRDAQADVDLFSWGLLRHEVYSRHVAQVLDMLQRVVSGDISVPLHQYIEQGILAPARDLLVKHAGENVRLSVLRPRVEEPDRWLMAWTAGHSLPGKEKYAERIVDTLSRHAYETGEAQHWTDATTDSAFRQNPLASTPTRTLVSLPIRRGDDVLGVFNAVSSQSAAFDAVEETYLNSLAGVIAVAVNELG